MGNIGGVSGSDPVGPFGNQVVSHKEIIQYLRDIFVRLDDRDLTLQKYLYITAELDKIRGQIGESDVPGKFKEVLNQLPDKLADLGATIVEWNNLQQNLKPHVDISEEFAEQLRCLEEQKMSLTNEIEQMFTMLMQ